MVIQEASLLSIRLQEGSLLAFSLFKVKKSKYVVQYTVASIEAEIPDVYDYKHVEYEYI